MIRHKRLVCYFDGCLQGRFNQQECSRCEEYLFGDDYLPGVMSRQLSFVRRHLKRFRDRFSPYSYAKRRRLVFRNNRKIAVRIPFLRRGH